MNANHSQIKHEKSLPSADHVRSLLDYCPESGLFVWRVATSRRTKVGQVAGSINGRGYLQICIDGKQYKAHRLAYLYMTGEWPADQIDHVDCNPLNNRWSNLRVATHSQNLANTGRRKDNTSGYKGVGWNKLRGKWVARVRFNGKSYHLGYFTDPAEAALSHAGAARLLFGDFSHSTINITINNYMGAAA